MASSSSSQARSIVSPKLYDVFISHRGPDVKETLAKELYDHLKAKECKAFHDREELQGGDSITSAIDNAIRSSLVQIAIFSKRYAESRWCLDELVLMLEQTDAVFIPVFYHVEPKELRSTEKGSYAAAFSHHQNKEEYCNKVPAWKKALASAADRSGLELRYHQDNLCEKIVSRVVQIVEEKKKISLHVAKYPVGLDELVQDFEKSCPMTAGVVGIFGLGGSGKTTLAKELFNRRRSGYHKSCFLSDVRESFNRGQLHCLQIQLCKDLFSQNQINISNKDQGIEELKKLLGRATHLHFLMILDDIDHEDQLNALLPESVSGSGTLVIITTRNRSVLRDADTSYKMKGMDKDHAKDLFCGHAFRGRDPPAEYEKLVESFVRFCGGLPLSLIVLGADVYNRDERYWESQLRKVEKTQPNDIERRLRISLDGLDREVKQIFIDIACFFNKKRQSNMKSKAIIIWEASGWSAEVAVQTLQDKCLVEVDEQIFEMHDHLRDLGRKMADKLRPPRLWQPELLRPMERKGFKDILAKTEGRCFHSFKKEYGYYNFIFCNRETDITYFIAETGLLWLEIRNGFVEYSFPECIPLQKLHILSVTAVEGLWSYFQKQLQTNTQTSFELRMLSIKSCDAGTVQNAPSLIGMFSHLEELRICGSLKKTDFGSLVQSLKQLSKLRSLDLESIEGDFFSGILNLNLGRSLETVKLCNLSNISVLVTSGELCPRLLSLHVSGLYKLKEMDLKQLVKLNTLYVGWCDQLETISGLSSLTGLGVSKMNAHLHRLEISKCPELKSIEGVEELAGLETLVIQMPDESNFGSREDTVFLGVFDGHGPYGHIVGRRVRDSLPSMLVNQWHELLSVESLNTDGNDTDVTVSYKYSHDANQLQKEEEPKIFSAWRESYLRAFKVMNKELKLHPALDCFCSGTTAVTIVKQGQDLMTTHVGDSRAVMGTISPNGSLSAIQLTIDLKENLPEEAERIKQCKGRVIALEDEPHVHRVWLPNENTPGLAMTRAFGDFCLKEFGVIAIPEVTYRSLTSRDQFIVLATDGVWDVLSNWEVVKIVSSAPTIASSAKMVVDSAVRAWRRKFPTSKIDDCAIVCMYSDSQPFISKHEKGNINLQPSADSQNVEESGTTISKCSED